MHFTALDWTSIVLFLLLTSAVAVFTRRFISDYDSFLLAGRNLKLYLAMATMGATELGLVTLMYFSQQGYASGFAAFSIGLISLAGFIFVGKTGFIIKGLRQLRCRTIAVFFGLRYDRNTQIIAALITFVAGMMNMGLFLVMGAKFLLYLVGFAPDQLPYIMVGLLLLVLLYTVVGGMVSVVLTDYIQFIILFTSVVLTTYFAIDRVGYGPIVTNVQAQYGEGGFNPLANPDMGWSFVIWLSIAALFSRMWPPALSRALSTTDSETTRKLYGFSGLSFLGRALLPMMWGIAAFAYFQLDPSIPFPTEDGEPDTAAAMPAYLAHISPRGRARIDRCGGTGGDDVDLRQLSAVLELDSGQRYRRPGAPALGRRRQNKTHPHRHRRLRRFRAAVGLSLRPARNHFPLHGHHRYHVLGQRAADHRDGTLLEKGQHRWHPRLAGGRRYPAAFRHFRQGRRQPARVLAMAGQRQGSGDRHVCALADGDRRRFAADPKVVATQGAGLPKGGLTCRA